MTSAPQPTPAAPATPSPAPQPATPAPAAQPATPVAPAPSPAAPAPAAQPAANDLLAAVFLAAYHEVYDNQYHNGSIGAFLSQWSSHDNTESIRLYAKKWFDYDFLIKFNH